MVRRAGSTALSAPLLDPAATPSAQEDPPAPKALSAPLLDPAAAPSAQEDPPAPQPSEGEWKVSGKNIGGADVEDEKCFRRNDVGTNEENVELLQADSFLVGGTFIRVPAGTYEIFVKASRSNTSTNLNGSTFGVQVFVNCKQMRTILGWTLKDVALGDEKTAGAEDVKSFWTTATEHSLGDVKTAEAGDVRVQLALKKKGMKGLKLQSFHLRPRSMSVCTPQDPAPVPNIQSPAADVQSDLQSMEEGADDAVGQGRAVQGDATRVADGSASEPIGRKIKIVLMIVVGAVCSWLVYRLATREFSIWNQPNSSANQSANHSIPSANHSIPSANHSIPSANQSIPVASQSTPSAGPSASSANLTCITRNDCNASQVCNGGHFNMDMDFTSSGGASGSISGHGTCTECTDLHFGQCFAPCRLSPDGLCVPDVLAFLLGLDLQIPFYLAILFGVMKLMFTLVVFTPTNKVTESDKKPWQKLTSGSWSECLSVSMRLLSFLFLLNGIKSDCLKFVASISNPSMTWTLTFDSVGVILFSSSNMPCAAAIFAQVGVTKVVDINQAGPLIQVYFYILLAVYIVPAFFLSIVAFLTMVAYLWFFLPMMILIRGMAFVLAPIASKIILRFAGETFLSLLNENFTRGLNKTLEEVDEVKDTLKDRARRRLPKWDRILGGIWQVFFSKDGGWMMEDAVSMISYVPMMSLACTLQARWLGGYGYWESFYLTVTERHVGTYLNLSRASGMHVANMIWLLL